MSVIVVHLTHDTHRNAVISESTAIACSCSIPAFTAAVIANTLCSKEACQYTVFACNTLLAEAAAQYVESSAV